MKGLRRNLPAGLASRCHPSRFCQLHLSQRLFGGSSKRRTRFEIRDIGDVTVVFIAEENVDVIVLHESLSIRPRQAV
jgi:hypothetical protein